DAFLQPRPKGPPNLPGDLDRQRAITGAPANVVLLEQLAVNLRHTTDLASRTTRLAVYRLRLALASAATCIHASPATPTACLSSATMMRKLGVTLASFASWRFAFLRFLAVLDDHQFLL